MKKYIFAGFMLAILLMTGCGSSQPTAETEEPGVSAEITAALEELIAMEDKAIQLGNQGQWTEAVNQVEAVRVKWEKIAPEVKKAGAANEARDFETSLASQTSVATDRHDSEEFDGTVGMGKQFIDNIISALEPE